MKSQLRPGFIFWMYMVLLLVSANVQKTIYLRPQSVHQWRQTDCAAQSLNYHQNKTGFWTPQVMNLAGTNGYAASEFPLVYYMVARLYDAFGFHESLHRGLTLLIAILGWYCLFLFTLKWIDNPWYALFPVVFMSTSPYYFFYANNFLPNVPAIAFALVGFYFFFKFWKTSHWPWYLGMHLLFLLSVVTKVSEGISYITIFVLISLAWLKKAPERPKMPMALHLVAFGVVIGLSAWWYLYARAFNALHGNQGSLLGILPIWVMNEEDWKLADYMVFDVWWSHYTHPFFTKVLIGLGILFPIAWRKLDPMLRMITLWLFIGVFAYSMLWFKAFGMHDYYTLTQIIFPVFLVLTMVEFGYRTLKNDALGKYIFSGTLLFLATILFDNNAFVQHDRYADPKYGSLIPTSLYDIEPYLRSIGIDRKDIVLSIPDPSPNISLYLMNNQGYTEAFLGSGFPIEGYQQKGAQYLIINDSSFLQKEIYQPYLTKQIGHFKGVCIFDIRPEVKESE